MTNNDSTTLDVHESGLTVTIILLVAGIVPIVVSWGQSILIPAVVGGILILSALAFRSLDLSVRDGRLRVRLGGLITVQDVALSEIAAVERTRFSALAGLGIRWTSRGTLYAVNFGEAVEIRLRSGSSFFMNLSDPDAVIEPLTRLLATR